VVVRRAVREHDAPDRATVGVERVTAFSAVGSGVPVAGMDQASQSLSVDFSRARVQFSWVVWSDLHDLWSWIAGSNQSSNSLHIYQNRFFDFLSLRYGPCTNRHNGSYVAAIVVRIVSAYSDGPSRRADVVGLVGPSSGDMGGDTYPNDGQDMQ
jgi:hypothetical protein